MLGYLIGSFPTAYLLVKWKSRLDIRESGSGNVGAMNTFDVTGSKFLGAIVLVIDLLKGALSVWVSSILLSNDFWVLGVGGIGAMVGHNYSPWIRFKGGRGLATAAGVLLIVSWVFVVMWCMIWILMFAFSRHIHLSNIVASIVSPLIVFVTPAALWTSIWMPSSGMSNTFMLCSFMCILILARHTKQMSELLKFSNKS
ncbi:MAG: glycerol-3-phosphate acyltransferase [Ignavibacteria bacterium]|nr:glycerol-3-phosphate acyltransferase [Ignavibacteria bacterium]